MKPGAGGRVYRERGTLTGSAATGGSVSRAHAPGTTRDDRPTGWPTIEVVLREFLAAKRKVLRPRRAAEYEAAADMLLECLNGYGHLDLSKKDRRLWDRHFNAEGEDHLEFCGLFGPEHLLPAYDHFLGWFMIRKVIGPGYLMRAAGEMTRDLAAWLGEKGLATAAETAAGVERGGRAARDLPKAESLAQVLYDFTQDGDPEAWEELEEEHFTVTRIEPGRLWLRHPDGRALGPVRVPRKASALCRVGWDIGASLGRRGDRWEFVESWSAYPS